MTGRRSLRGFMFRTLDPDKILATIETLRLRVNERFPSAGIAKVASELVGIAKEARARCSAMARPMYGLRLLSGLVVIAGLVGLGVLALGVRGLQASTELFGMMQGIDAGVNMLIVVGGALFFLMSLETRLKRRVALGHLHELRSIVHVIDMHQLTKDPSIMLGQGAPTSHSPHRTMTPFELTRYLDYCSEMLSLSAKIGALYAQSTTDTEVIEVVNDIERLTTNLSSKIWQKITLVESASRHAIPASLQASAAAIPAEAPRLGVPATVKPGA